MSMAADGALARACGSAFLPVSFVVGLLLPPPALADVAPGSALLVHVQPVSAESDWCLRPPATTCGQIVRTATQEGQLEFILFFMKGADGGGCLKSVHTVLTWPWELVAWDVCFASAAWLDESGPAHELYLEWWDDYPLARQGYPVVPVARFVMNVTGPGRFDFAGTSGEAVVAGQDCAPPSYVTYPIQVFAEAGIPCGRLGAQCGYYTRCEPIFHVPQLVLTAPAGGAADTTLNIEVATFMPCSITVDGHVPWLTGSVWYEYGWHLYVHADAAGLTPGTYLTSMEVGTPVTSRCLPTTFIVQGTTSTTRTSWGRVKSLYR